MDLSSLDKLFDELGPTGPTAVKMSSRDVAKVIARTGPAKETCEILFKMSYPQGITLLEEPSIKDGSDNWLWCVNGEWVSLTSLTENSECARLSIP